MFGFGSKQRALNELLQRMNQYAVVIQIACCHKIVAGLKDRFDEDKAKNITTAVVNRLFGKPVSPMHASLDSAMIDEIGADFMRRGEDEELRRGVIMSLRTLMSIAGGAQQTAAMLNYQKTLEWIGGIVPLPPEAPDPEMMEQLASTMYHRYSGK